MNKYVKYALIAVAGVVLVVVALVAVVAATFNPNDYKPMIVKLVQDKKQRTLNIEGDIKLAFWPKIGADLGRISISEHKSDKQFASVNGLKVSLALLPLLAKQLVVDTVYVDGAQANIVRNEDGSFNFDDLLSKEEEEPSEQIKFDVEGIVISDSAVSFKDLQAKAEYSISKFNLKTGEVALAKPFDLSTDFSVAASQPKVLADVKLKGNFMADPEQQHFVVQGLDALVTGAVDDIQDLQVKLSGNVDAKPQELEFIVDRIQLAVAGKRDGASIKADLDAPQLVMRKDQLLGKEATLNLSQQKDKQSVTAKVVLADIAGTPAQFTSGGIRAEVNAVQGEDTVQAKLTLADVKGTQTTLQSSGVNGEFTAKQGARNVAGKFSAPFNGNLEQLVFDIPKLAGTLNIKDPALPKGALAGDFAVKLHADVKQQRADTQFTLNVDSTRLQGDVDVAGFATPAIKFNLNADKLDLNALLGKPSKTAAAAPAKDSGPAKAPDLSALSQLQLDGKVNMGSILYDQYRISNLALTVKADGSKLSINPISLKLDDSQIKGMLAISQFAKPLYTFDIEIDKIDANRYVSAAPAAGESKPAAKTAGDDKPLDLSALKALNANGSLRIGSLKYGEIQSSNIRIDLKADGEKLSLNPLAAKVDDSQINANLGITRYANPVFNFNVNIDKLDADRYITKDSSAPAKTAKPAAKTAEDTPIDLSALKKFNASGEANIGALKLANVKTSNVKVGLNAADGVVNVSPFAANLYQGSMAGNLKVDARSTPVISFKQDMQGITIGPLLADAINNDMLDGKGNLKLDVSTQGASVNALKQALNGTAALNLADGAVKGIDIAGTLRGVKNKLNVLKGQDTLGADQSKKTDFSEMKASFNIKNGVAHNDDLSMKAPLFRITGAGDIDIGKETINYLAKPTVVSSLKGQGGDDLAALNGLTIPVKLTGTFSAPKYGMDFAAVGSAFAKSQLIDKVGGDKAEAVKGLLGGSKEDALKSLIGGKKAAPAPAPAGTESGAPAPTEAAPAEPAPAPATPEDQVKKKLNNILGF